MNLKEGGIKKIKMIPYLPKEIMVKKNVNNVVQADDDSVVSDTNSID